MSLLDDARAALAERRFDDALRAARAAVAAAPSDAEALALRAEARRRLGDLDGAQGDITRALELSPEPRFLGARAELRRRRGDWEGAAADARAAAEAGAESGWVQLAEAERCAGRLHSALAAADKGARGVEGAWPLVARAKVLRALGRAAEAEAELVRAIRLEPDSYLARAWRGEALRALGRRPEALRELDEALRLEPACAWAAALRGLVRLESGEPGGEAELAEAFALDSSASGAYDFLGDGRSGLARDSRCAWVFAWRGGLEDLGRAVALDPEAAWLRARRGEALARAGRWRRALGDLGRAVEARREDCRARFWRAEARRALGDARGALCDLNMVLHLEPDLQAPGAPSALFGLARVSRALLVGDMGQLAAGARLLPEGAVASALEGLSPAARRAFRAGLRRPPERSDRDWRLGADALFEAGRGAEARREALRALRRAPWAPGLHLIAWRGQHPRGLGSPRGAEHLERAVALGLDAPEAWAWLGRARLDAGRWRPGLDALARACRLDPARAWEHAAWPATFCGVAPRRPNEARRRALRALRVPRALAPLRSYLLSRLASVLGFADEAERALRAARPLFAAAPWFHDAALGELLVRRGRFAAALAPLSRAADAPAEARSLFWRAEARWWLGERAAAERDWEAGLARAPGRFWALAWRAQSMLWQGRWEEAERLAGEAAAAEPGHGWAWGWRGAARMFLGRHGEALADLRRARRLDPSDREARLFEAEALARAGRLSAAEAALDRAVRADPGHPWAWALRAWLRGKLGRERGMLADYSQAGHRAPGLLKAWRPRGGLLSREEARADLERALEAARGNRTWRTAS